MQSVNSFSACYLFKGQTYLAKQRLEQFIKTIQTSASIWEKLEKFDNSSSSRSSRYSQNEKITRRDI